jgi:superkiller protein 3
LAFALDKKNKLDEAETTYKSATTLKPGDSQAWQGLVKLYQRLGAKKLSEYQHAALKLAEIYRDADEMFKCQDVVDKFIDFARAQGERQQYVEALNLILPDSPIYPALEGRVPHPAKTYETVAQITETDEKKRINTLIGERRTRIGAKVNEVTLEVKREVFSQSKLGYIYRQLIDWSNDDDTRRVYEEKLLQYCYERLLAFPPGKDKSQELQIVLKLSNDMVIIKHPFKTAWDIVIDWKDSENIKDMDVGILREYCGYFPDSDLTRVLSGFLTSSASPFPKEEKASKAKSPGDTEEDESEDDDDDGGGVQTTYEPTTEEDRLLLMTEGISSASSVFAYRLMGEYYQYLEEYESNVELMRRAKSHLIEEQAKTGLDFQYTMDACSLYLGTALVYYQSPRHHQEAKSLFDGVLAHNPSSTAALIGVGLIWEEEEEYDEAISFLERAMSRDESNLRVRAEAAWVKALKGDYENGKEGLEACVPLIAKDTGAKELLAQTQYRLGYCIWNLDTSRAIRKDRNGAYAYFMAALKSDLNYAPAYTSLGIYYADYAKDKKRALRCFQKAVELSSSEVESAERLARLFADDGDWDRVELVAQRVVDSGKVKPPPGSKRKGISWPFSSLGVAELNKQEHHKAIVSFQSALKISPEDYHSWVGLGESYYASGRYVAATKAIMHAQKLEETPGKAISGEVWFTKFILANIKRELGSFDEAIELYRTIIKDRPEEAGVVIALMQSSVESAFDSIDKGFYGKAVKLARDTLTFATQAPKEVVETFNFWRAVADSCSVYSQIQSRVTEFPTEALRQLLGDDDTIEDYQTLKDIDGVGFGVVFAKGIFPDDEKVGVDLTRCLHATILSHKRALHVAAHDTHAHAVAYYNLGWAEYRAHSCLPESMRKRSSRYLKAAIRCFKRAIELEAGNSEFWNSLGVVTSGVNPSVSQHSFVRSLVLNERSAQTWTNLGTLALLENDAKLANEAFTRAQSTDPDYAHAWLGQGLIALLHGDAREARGLFTHAMEISESSSVPARQLYPVSLFDQILSAPANLPISYLIQPIFALGQQQSLHPQNLAFGHLSALFQERVNDHALVVSALEKICSTVEEEYEVTESAQALRRFALAKTDLARSYLAAGLFAKAIEAGELAIQLSSDESDNELSAEERKKARLSAHLTVGLAQYYSEDVAEALAYFEAALEESDGNPDASCVLAQVLWATGSSESRDRARDVLFRVIESSPGHVQSVLLLGVISLLDADEDSLEAVIDELQALRVSDKGVTGSQQSQIGHVLQAISAAGQSTSEEAVLSQVQTDIMLHPHLPHGWSELSSLAVGEEAQSAAEMSLRVARRGVPPRGDLGAADLAKAYAGTGRAADAQTSIMVAPWSVEGWLALGDAVAR